jgi:predicted DsbA family dithiol-disulfide isomerase
MPASSKPTLLASVFSDYICPFCYIGDLRLARLREYFDLKINWMLVEIHPETPPLGTPVSALGYGSERWQQMMASLQQLADEEQVILRQPAVNANSRKALQLAEAAKQAGAEVFYRLHRRLFEAYFTEGQNIGDETVLRQLATESGLNASWIDLAWNDPRIAKQLQENLVLAGKYQVRATPTVFFSEQHRIDGAMPYAQFLEAAQNGLAVQLRRSERAAVPPTPIQTPPP